MAKRMLIDASHPEETRVVVQSGNRLEDFDYETSSRKQLKGNIYLAKITRVEPSLQAAFVDYGGNRHGFLPFSEIHPDYYRIPIADREALLAEEAALKSEPADEIQDYGDNELPAIEAPEDAGAADRSEASSEQDDDNGAETTDGAEDDAQAAEAAAGNDGSEAEEQAEDGEEVAAAAEAPRDPEQVETEERVDTVGGDEMEEAQRRRAQLLRRYKIQEVIKRRQVLLVQVTKEERGNKGAALTTYLSLPGRYCVLMPNTNKGGGISRKISNASDRRRLKGILSELDIPEGIAVIVRTAGSQRTKLEIRRDYEYLLRLWDSIRQSTLQSTAPALIYEEANLIKRAIRDLYSRDMDEVLVDGEEGYKAAKDFMKSLTPSHAKKVQQYKDINHPLFQRYQVESQLDAMHSNTVQLRSGGYLVFNQTEALVAVDVNSGRATRERHIEETALKTNLEAADEVGRQLRLRDLAGLIVIDFIDMEESRRNREVERRLKEALKNDRARIQLGRISPFGLLEMSRQRLRPSLFESSTETCPHCRGDGRVRTVESLALQVLRRLEEEGIREPGGEMSVTVPTQVALYLLNKKRHHVVAIEERYDFKVSVETDDHLATDAFTIERDGVIAERRVAAPSEERREERRDDRREGRRDDRGEGRSEGRSEGRGEGRREAAGDAEGEDGERRRGRRSRRGRRRRDDDRGGEREDRPQEARGSDSRGRGGRDSVTEVDEEETDVELEAEAERGVDAEASEDEQKAERKRKRRGKRGGRRRSRRRDDETSGETREATSESEGGDAYEAETAETADGEGYDGDGAGDGARAESGGDEEKPRGRRRSRGNRGGRSRGRGQSGDASEPAEAVSQASEEAQAEADTEEAEEFGSFTNGSHAEHVAEPLPAAAAPTATTPPPDISATDPKVVIESATPGTSPSTEQAAGEEVDTLEPPHSDKAEDDQPKRRGWWNRFV
ncbi:ribonuclease E/G [Pelagibius sp. 7325]|uniref:Rne/Rng family ribonuclease n=1 Tax=Pelagibius sp. 7325 TaxID=3131994 RepID=UPI0030EBCD92